MRKRSNAAVFAASLIAHIGIAVAWLTTHPPPRFVEPATLQIELIRPAERRRPPPREKPQTAPPARAGLPVLAAPPTAAIPAARPEPLVLSPPKTLDVQHMTDQELLQRAGPRPDVAKVFEEQARQPVFSRALGRNPEDMRITDCKPFTEHSNRIAPPCPVRKTPEPAGGPAVSPPTLAMKESPFAAEARRKEAIRTYRQGYGSSGAASVNDYPSLGCTFAHVNCRPADPTMDPLHPPSRDH